MRKPLTALALLAISCGPALAANQPGAVVQLPSVAKLATSDYSNTPQIQLTGYWAGSTQGGGNLILKTCTPDTATCFSDSAGHTFQRTDFGSKNIVDARQCGVKGIGLSNDDYAALNLCLQLAHTLNIPTVSTGGGQVYDNTADIVIPQNVTLDCGLGNPSSVYTNNDFTLASGLTHVIAMPGNYTIRPNTHGNASIQNCIVEQSAGAYAPATFVPVTLRDSLNEIAGFYGSAITDDAPSFTIRNVYAYGYANCFYSQTGNKRGRWFESGGHCDVGMNLNNNGEVLPVQTMNFQPFLTRQNGTASQNNWQIDNVINDGAGRYRAIAEIPTSDITILANDQFAFQSPTGSGVQSATGIWLAGTPTIVGIGTDGCLVTQCQELTLLGTSGNSDSQDSQPSDGTALSFSATWTVGAPANAISIPTGDITNVSVGQTVAQTGGCGAIQSGTVVKDVWLSQRIVYLTKALTCGSSGTLAFADTNFIYGSNRANQSITISAVHNNGDCVKFFNVAGFKAINIHCFGHSVAFHCMEQSGNYDIVNGDNGSDEKYYDPSIIGFVGDGNHVGTDCSGGSFKNGILSQHATVGIKINSDANNGKAAFEFSGVGLGPSTGKIVGTILDVEAGTLVLSNGFGSTPGNIFVSNGTTFRNLYPSNTDASTGYQVGNILTSTDAGCSVQPQVTVTAIGGGGSLTSGGLTQTTAGVCSPWPATFTAGTNLSCANGSGSGCGTGAVLITDGNILADLTLGNSTFTNGDLYIEDQFTADNHVRGCGNAPFLAAIYSQRTGLCIGGASVATGTVIDGTATSLKCDATSGAKTITVNAGSTLPDFAFTVTKTDSTSNLCIITMTSGDTIGGASSTALAILNDSLKAKNINGSTAWMFTQ